MLLDIPDFNLEKAIKKQLHMEDISDITCIDLLFLTKLDASESGIENLEGIQFAENLSSLNLSSNKISDISKLGDLKELHYLFLGNNKISDISKLTALKELQYLLLGNNELIDVSPISNLSNMEVLGLDYNFISDISLITPNYYPNLKRLTLTSNCLDINESTTKPMKVITNLLKMNVDVKYKVQKQTSDCVNK